MAKIVTSSTKLEQATEVQDLLVRPKVNSYDFKTALVDNNKDPVNTLIQYVGGSKQRVVYFRQILKNNDAVAAHDVTLEPINQQYERIDGLDILAQGSLSFSHDSEHRQSDITGSAYIRPPMIPNIGDVMLLDFGRGTLGKFHITEVTRLSHQKDTVFEVNYKLVHEVIDQVNDKYMIDLNKKTVGILKWSDNFLQNGQNPLLIPEDADAFEKLRKHYLRLVKYWFDKFYIRFYQCMPVPQQKKLLLDGYLMKAVSKWFSSRDHQAMVSFNLFGMDEIPLLGAVSLWDALSSQDEWMLGDAFKNAVVVSTEAFKARAQYAQVSQSSFDGVVCTGNLRYTGEVWSKSDWVVGEVVDLPAQPTVQVSGAEDGRPYINQVFLETGYVLSHSFWHNEPEGMSHLEIMVRNYFEDEHLDKGLLIRIIDDSRRWGELEQYYLMPILLLLINYSIRRM